MSQRLRGFKESAVETVFLVKVCLTCFWFWLPVLFAACFFIQLWMIVMIHPLTLFILPGILSIYSMLENEKRLKLQYGLEKKRRLKALHPLGSGPQELKGYRWNVEKTIEEYNRSKAERRSKK